jgi:polar amino acid transport system permease protein
VTRRPKKSANEGVLGGVIAAVSTLVVFGGLIALIGTSPGWPNVRKSFFDWKIFKETFPEVLSRLLVNVKYFMIIEVCVLALGLTIAVVRSLRGPVFFPFRVLATAYTHVLRGVPTLLLLFLFGFGIPGAFRLPRPWNSGVLWGAVALTLNYSAFVAEVFRSGINSIHPSQSAAARSLGLTQLQAYRTVIVPQAIRRVIPPLLNDFVALQKETALLSSLGLIEMLRQAQIETGKRFNFTPYVAATVIFLCLTIPLALFTDWIVERRKTS